MTIMMVERMARTPPTAPRIIPMKSALDISSSSLSFSESDEPIKLSFNFCDPSFSGVFPIVGLSVISFIGFSVGSSNWIVGSVVVTTA